MTTERLHMVVRGIPVDVDRKAIKNLHVGVYPPDGRVRVAAPERLDHEAIRLAVVSRLGWIRRQQRSFADQVRQSAREMVTGESHWFRGRRYNLDVIERDAPPTVRLRNNRTLELQVRPGAATEKRAAVLTAWYRQHLRDDVAGLIPRWEPNVGVTVADWGVRKMKTKWGSCNTDAGRIWLNLELAKKPHTCVEYIVVHEMVHLLERHHTDRFREIMDGLLPNWRVRRDELNSAPLAHEHWEY